PERCRSPCSRGAHRPQSSSRRCHRRRARSVGYPSRGSALDASRDPLLLVGSRFTSTAIDTRIGAEFPEQGAERGGELLTRAETQKASPIEALREHAEDPL